MTYSYQDLQNKLKKINEDQLKTVNDNIWKLIDSVEKGHGDINDNVKTLKDLHNEQKTIEAEINALT
jgi:hypothetical protein